MRLGFRRILCISSSTYFKILMIEIKSFECMLRGYKYFDLRLCSLTPNRRFISRKIRQHRIRGHLNVLPYLIGLTVILFYVHYCTLSKNLSNTNCCRFIIFCISTFCPLEIDGLTQESSRKRKMNVSNIMLPLNKSKPRLLVQK